MMMTNTRHNCRNPRSRRDRCAAIALSSDSKSGARQGISLLEVLISMFVLLFGLMGVASIFPVGNHYAGRGEQFDRSSALAEAGFADLKARGILRPERWYYANRPNADNQLNVTPAPVIRPNVSDFNVPAGSSNGPGYGFVIDPTGTALGLYDPSAPMTASLDYFPYIDLSNAPSVSGNANTEMPAAWKPAGTTPGLVGDRWPLRRLSLPVPNPSNPTGPSILMNEKVAETIFRLHDDVTNELPKESDRPGVQRWLADPNGAPLTQPWNHRLLARQYAGKYSWIATVVPTSPESVLALQPVNSRFGSDLYEVSVAVFNDREAMPPSAATERTISAQMLQGGELLIYDANYDNVDAAAKGIRPGNWIAVAGVHPTNPAGQFLLRWYRVLSIDDETDTSLTTGPNPLRRLMLDGPEWPLTDTGGGVRAANDLRAILLPGVISVSTQMLPMESVQ